MKIELKVLLILMSIFILINLTIDETKFSQENINNSKENITYKKEIIIENTEYIIDEMKTLNQSKEGVRNITNLDKQIELKELEEKNKVFIELTNNLNSTNISNE